MSFHPESRQKHPSLLKCVWQKGCRALHGDRWPLKHRGPHTSPQPANWGLALQPRLLAPNPLPKSSANLGGSPPLSSNHWPVPLPPSLRPSVGLQHSSVRHMALELRRCCPGPRDSSTSAVPTFQPGGCFVGGISCGLSCQRGTITAAQQSLAVTGGHSARGCPTHHLALVWKCHFELNAHYKAICISVLFIQAGKNTSYPC